MATSKFMISEESGMPKWKIAAAVGGVVLVSAGMYMIYKKATVKTDGKQPKGTSLKGSKTSNGTSATANDNAVGKARKYKTEGNSHFRAGAYTEAIRCYDKAIENCPKDASNDLSTFYQNRAAAFEHEKEWESVLRDCTSALELNPRYGKAMQRRARAAEHLDDLDTALEDYTAICIIESFSNQESLTQVDRILKKIGMTHAQEIFGKSHSKFPSVYAIRSYFKGFCCDAVYNSLSTEKEGDGDEAEDIPEKNTVTEGYLRARQHMRAERFDAVLECCTAELSNPLSTYTAPALLLQGAMYALTLQKSNATKSFNRLAEMEEADKDLRVAALVKLGCLQMAFGLAEEASVTYNRALNLDTKNADVYHQRGQMHLMMNDIRSAMENFAQVVELNDDFAIGHVQKLHTDYRYAIFSGDRARSKQVIKHFEELQKKFPKCNEVYLLLAQILMDDEDYTGADSHFKKLFAIEPDSPLALVYRAMLLVQWKGDIDGAKKMMNRALEIDEHCELALENLATICVQTGDLEQGVRLFNRAIPLAKSLNEMAHYFSLRDAAVAQIKVVERLGIMLPSSSGM